MMALACSNKIPSETPRQQRGINQSILQATEHEENSGWQTGKKI